MRTKRTTGAAAAAVAGIVVAIIGVLLVADYANGIFGFLILQTTGGLGLLLYALFLGGIVWGPILLVVGLAFLNEAWWTREATMARVLVLFIAAVGAVTTLFLFGLAFYW